MKKIHFISIGGRIMHALALVLQEKGYEITGSDDEIYDPSLARLKEAGLAPPQFGWFPNKVDKADAVILGMHARADNPELKRAQKLDLPIYSFPSFVSECSSEKKKVVITGSHGKTTTTSMIMYVLKFHGVDFDYLVGAKIEGFDKMVKLTDAPLILIEGDEYLSSPIDRRPKFYHFNADLAVMTGIAWDHINVFPTEQDYIDQFSLFTDRLDSDARLFYYEKDPKVKEICEDLNQAYPYSGLVRSGEDEIRYKGRTFAINVIGEHNLQNMSAALQICIQLGISETQFFEAIESFTGADRRLQVVKKTKNRTIFFDFAHAPSKVIATTNAVQDWYPKRKLVACLELHTYSSLNKEFMPQYAACLNAADHAIVFFSEHAMQIKKMPTLKEEFVRSAFERKDLKVFTDEKALFDFLQKLKAENTNLLLMSSGRFGGMPVSELW